MENQNRLLREFNGRPGATDVQIATAEARMGFGFPRDYVQFLRETNGGEGFIGEAYANLWDVAELSSLNAQYESEKYAPGLLIFGSDGGGEAFGFDTRDPEWPIVQIPFVGMSWQDARSLGATFDAFLENLFAGNLL